MLMKYYDEILDFGCFTRNDLESLITNKKTINSLLLRFEKKGYIKRVKHNYYVAMDIVNDVPFCNKYQIATLLNDSNYIAYHSALEYYSYHNQVFNNLTFCSNTRVNDFIFDNISFHYVKSKCPLQINQNYDGIKITSLERTIVDCIDQIDLAGGVEEVFRALDSIHTLDEEKIIEILDFYNKKVLYQRTGYLLEFFKENLNISDSTLEYIHSRIGLSKCYLNSSKKIENVIFNKKWHLCVPTYVSSILTKGTYSHEIQQKTTKKGS